MVITRMIHGWLARGEVSYPVAPVWRYWSGDPLALSLMFPNGDVLWTSREMVRQAMNDGGAVGDGDIMVVSDYITVELLMPNIPGPGTSIRFEFNTILGFLTDTYYLVPLGREVVDVPDDVSSLERR